MQQRVRESLRIVSFKRTLQTHLFNRVHHCLLWAHTAYGMYCSLQDYIKIIIISIIIIIVIIIINRSTIFNFNYLKGSNNALLKTVLY